MASAAKKKPAAATRRPRAPAAPPPRSRLAPVGWLAAAALAAGWAWSDGRPVRLAQNTLSRWTAPGAAAPAGEPDAVGGLIRTAAVRPSPAPLRPAVADPAPPPPAEQRTGSIHPKPRPAVEAVAPRVAAATPEPARAPKPPVPAPARTPAEPSAHPGPGVAPPLPVAAVRPPVPEVPVPMAVPASLPAAAAEPRPVGGERHATRTLAVHAAPDGAASKLGEIASGTGVSVLRVSGDWRYVRSARTGIAGWIDGRFLAGEAGGAVPATAPAVVADRTARMR